MVGVIPDTFTMRELIWMAEAKSRRDWEHTSSLMALIANCNRDPKKQKTPFSPKSFNPHEIVKRKKAKVNISKLKHAFIPLKKGEKMSNEVKQLLNGDS